MKGKKLLALLVASAMAVSLLAGCGGGSDSNSGGGASSGGESGSAAGGSENGGENGSDEAEGYSTEIDMEEEPYTVAIQVVTLPGTDQPGEEEREAAINAITEPAINCKVDIQEVWISEIANTTSMAVAGDEKIDLVHVATVSPLSSMVGSDILLDMNEGNLLQNRGKDLIALFGEDIMAAGNVGGRQLAVPAKNFNAQGKGIAYNKTVADEIGLTIPENITFDELDEILAKVHEAKPDMMAWYSGNGELNYMRWLYDYESFGNEAAYGVILDPENDTTVVNLYDTDLFKDYALRCFHWTQDGIQPGDPTDTNTAQDYLNAQKLFCATVNMNPEQRALWGSYGEQNGFEMGFAQLVEPKITNSTVTEFMWGIAINSERPDKAMDFLNFLYSNAEVANILEYGFEGENYEFVEGSDKVITINGSYQTLFYNGGDMRTLYVTTPAGEDYVDQLEALEAEASVSPLVAYMFDDTDFQTESSVINTTILEYLPRLMNGMCESEEATLALIDEFNEKLAASGINDVIAANQAQIDEFMASQGQ